MLIDLAATAEVFHTPTGIAYADLTIDGHRETWPVRGPRVRAWLRRGYYEATRNVPSTQVPRLCRGGRSSLTFTAVFHRRDSPSVSYQHVMRGGSAMAIPRLRLAFGIAALLRCGFAASTGTALHTSPRVGTRHCSGSN